MSGSDGMYGAYFIADLAQIREYLTSELKEANRSSSLAVIVFANAKKKFVKDEISPLVSYWNYRSGNYVSFFFPGHLGDDSVGASDYSPIFDLSTGFHEKTFVETIEEIEEEAKDWVYKGDTPIIICRAYLQYQEATNAPSAFLDLSSIIEFELERAIRNEAIESVESFFEAIIKAAKEIPGGDVDWQLGMKLGRSALRESLVDAVVSTLPPGARRIADVFFVFRPKLGTMDGQMISE